MGFLRKFRGVVGTAITWGVTWAIAAVVFAIGVEIFGAGRTTTPFGSALFSIGLFFGVFGTWAGAVFALLMAASERRRAFAQLSGIRVALWGIGGAMSLPLTIVATSWRQVQRIGLPDNLPENLVFAAVLGALSAWGMLAIARHARDVEPQLLGGASETPAPKREAEHVAR